MYFYKFLSGGDNKAVDISDILNDFVEDTKTSTQEENPGFFDLDNPKSVDIPDILNDFVEDTKTSIQKGHPDFFDLDNPKFVNISDIWKYFVYKCKTSTQEENPDFFDLDNSIIKLKFIMSWVGFLGDIKDEDSFSASLKNEIKDELITKRFFIANNHDLKK